MGTIINRFITELSWQKAPEAFSIAGDEVHIWLIKISSNLNHYNALKNLLSIDELQRADKYRQLKDHQRFIISRGAQRIILGRYIGASSGQLQFKLGENKKPYLEANGGNCLNYNLSHSGDLIVLAVSQLPVGADIEFIDKKFALQDILPDNFSDEEAQYILESDRINRFFTLWTRKESILKATGRGLGEHLKVTPVLDGLHQMPADVSVAVNDWKLESFMISDDYVASITAGLFDWKARLYDMGDILF